jgi:hypothetical protein
MPYQDEIIEKLQKKYNLSQEQQRQLRASLIESDMQQTNASLEKLIIKFENQEAKELKNKSFSTLGVFKFLINLIRRKRKNSLCQI